MKTRYSISGRLTVWFFLSACVLLISASSLFYWSLVEIIHREDETVLDGRIQTLQAILQRHDGAMAAAKRRIESEWPLISPQRSYVRLQGPSGDIFSISPSVPQEVVSELFDQHPPTSLRSSMSSGKHYLAVSKRLKLIDGGEVLADVAIDLSYEKIILPSYRIQMALILLTELLLAFLIGRWLASASLSPVKRIAEKASKIGPSNLQDRIATENLPEELLVLVTTFNDMLDRLSESFSRLNSFSSDIAHELRTPISNMRGEIEIALNKTRTPKDYEEILASALEELERISQITDALMFLAKSENPTTHLNRENCDLRSELKKIAELFEDSALDLGIKLLVEVDAPEVTLVWANRTFFRQAVANLTSNAIAHTPSGGLVQIKARKTDGGVEVAVVDTGEGIAPEHLHRVFDRFYRADPSRTRAGSGRSAAGSGLGLSIVQAIVKLHGGTIEIQSRFTQGTSVVMRFPDEPKQI